MDNDIVFRGSEIAVRRRRASLSPLLCLHILTHYVSIYSLNHTDVQNNIWISVSSQDRYSLSTTVCGVTKDGKVEKKSEPSFTFLYWLTVCKFLTREYPSHKSGTHINAVKQGRGFSSHLNQAAWGGYRAEASWCAHCLPLSWTPKAGRHTGQDVGDHTLFLLWFQVTKQMPSVFPVLGS